MPLDLISQNICANRSYVYMTRADGHEPPIDLLIPGVDSGMWLGHHKLKNTSSPASQFPKLSSCACVCVLGEYINKNIMSIFMYF